MSILSTKEQIEFLLLKNADASTEELAELIAERVDQCLAEARPRSGQRGGDAIKQLLKGVGEAVAEQSRNQTREHAAQLAERPVADDAPAPQPEVVQP